MNLYMASYYSNVSPQRGTSPLIEEMKEIQSNQGGSGQERSKNILRFVMAGWGCEFSRHRLIDDSQPRKIAKWCSPDIEENAKLLPIPRINQKPVAEFLVPRLRDKNSATLFVLEDGSEEIASSRYGFLPFLQLVVKSSSQLGGRT